MTERMNRRQAANLIGISPNTLYLWERQGKVPRPRFVDRNHRPIYTQELVAAALEYKNRTFESHEEWFEWNQRQVQPQDATTDTEATKKDGTPN